MKTKLILLIASVLLLPLGSLLYCQGNNSVTEPYVSSFKELQPKIDSILKEYVDYSCSESINNHIVVKLYILSYIDSTVFILTHSQYLHAVFDRDVSGYNRIDNCLIIIYSDLNRLFRSDPLMISSLKKMELNLKHLKKIGDGPTADDYSPWIVSIQRETNNIKVIKRAIEPYFYKVQVDTVRY